MKQYTKTEDPQNLFGQMGIYYEGAFVRITSDAERLQMFAGLAQEIAGQDDDKTAAMEIRALVKAFDRVSRLYANAPQAALVHRAAVLGKSLASVNLLPEITD